MKTIIDPNEGRLVWLLPGNYPVLESHSKERYVLSLDEQKQALLLELQGGGARVHRAGQADDNCLCWYALIEGEIVVVWDDQIIQFGEDNG